MELSLTRAPLRRRPNAEPNDGFPPTAADFRTIQDGLQSTQSGHPPVLLDDLIGEGEDRPRDGEAECLGGLEIDY